MLNAKLLLRLPALLKGGDKLVYLSFTAIHAPRVS